MHYDTKQLLSDIIIVLAIVLTGFFIGIVGYDIGHSRGWDHAKVYYTNRVGG